MTRLVELGLLHASALKWLAKLLRFAALPRWLVSLRFRLRRRRPKQPTRCNHYTSAHPQPTLWTPPEAIWWDALDSEPFPPTEPTIHPLRNLVMLMGDRAATSLPERVVMGFCDTNLVDPTMTGQPMLSDPSANLHAGRMLRALGILQIDRLRLFREYRHRVCAMDDGEEKRYLTREYMLKQAHLCVDQIPRLPLETTSKMILIPLSLHLLRMVRMQIGLDANQDVEESEQALALILAWHDRYQGLCGITNQSLLKTYLFPAEVTRHPLKDIANAAYFYETPVGLFEILDEVLPVPESPTSPLELRLGRMRVERAKLKIATLQAMLERVTQERHLLPWAHHAGGQERLMQDLKELGIRYADSFYHLAIRQSEALQTQSHGTLYSVVLAWVKERTESVMAEDREVNRVRFDGSLSTLQRDQRNEAGSLQGEAKRLDIDSRYMALINARNQHLESNSFYR